MLLLTYSASSFVYHCDSTRPQNRWTQLVTLFCKDLSMMQTVLACPVCSPDFPLLSPSMGQSTMHVHITST